MSRYDKKEPLTLTDRNMTTDASTSKIGFAVIGMAVLGLISGILSTFQPDFIKLLLHPISLGLGIDGVGILPGILFAFIVSFALFVYAKPENLSVGLRLTLSFVITVAAWVAAVHTALYIYDLTSLVIKHLDTSQLKLIGDHLNRFFAGFCAGAVGASIIFGGCAMLVSSFRIRKIWLTGILIGATAGLFLWAGLESGNEYLGPLVMFIVWQMAISAWLGYALTSQTPRNA